MKRLLLIMMIVLMTGSLFGQSTFKKGAYIGEHPTGSNVVLLDSVIYTGGLLKFYNGSSLLSVGSGSMTYPGSGIALSDGSQWLSSITNNSANWNTAYTDRLKWDGGATGLTAATGRTSLGATTVGSALFLLTNPSAITFLRINADNSVSALSQSNFKTALSLVSSDVGLGNVTNESKATMFTSPTFTGSPTVPGYVPTSTTVNGHALTGNISVTASDVSLGNVTNESKATMFTSPTFTGTVTIPTPFTLGAVSVTTTGTELNYVSGVTSAIQTQLGAKLNTADSTGISPGNYVTHTQLYDTISDTDVLIMLADSGVYNKGYMTPKGVDDVVAGYVQIHPDTTAITDNYILVLGDDGKRIRANKATSMTVTLPPSSSVAFAKEATIYVQQLGAGPIVFKAGTGVTIYSELDSIALNTQYRWAAVIYWGNDNYQLIGTTDQ